MQSVPKHSCSKCSLRDICLPMGVGKTDLERLDELVKNSKVHHQNDVVIRQDDTFDTLFAIKSGMYKSVKLNSDGEEYVSGFHLPGDIIGLDAIYPEAYTSSLIALTSSVLCQLDYKQLVSLSSTIAPLQHQLMRLSSKEINTTQAFQGAQTAEQKLASFIHNLAVRNEVRGFSATELLLAMTRQDIANHLGMAAETVSRLLKSLQNRNVLEIKSREMSILDPAVLLELTGCAHV